MMFNNLLAHSLFKIFHFGLKLAICIQSLENADLLSVESQAIKSIKSLLIGLASLTYNPLQLPAQFGWD
jgi:hypothetical protein